MKRRGVPLVLDRSNVKIRVVPYKGVARLVTLDDPEADTTIAQDAFVRLRPPADHPPLKTASWRDVVATKARAVRVLPAPRSTLPEPQEVPEVGKDIRAVAIEMARASGDAALVDLVEEILARAEAEHTP